MKGPSYGVTVYLALLESLCIRFTTNGLMKLSKFDANISAIWSGKISSDQLTSFDVVATESASAIYKSFLLEMKIPIAKRRITEY